MDFLSDPNIDPATGEAWGGVAPGGDPTVWGTGGAWDFSNPGYVPAESPYPVVYSDPGANAGGSMTESGGRSAPGGSGFGTWLTGLGSLAGGILKGTGIYSPGAGTPGSAVGVTLAGAPCQLGMPGCQTSLNAAQSANKSQTTMLIMAGVGALVLIIVLRK